MPCNIRIVSTYPPRRCGIGTFSRDLSNALSNFTGEVGHIRVAAIDKDRLAYNIPVDLVIDQYNRQSWCDITEEIIKRAKEGANPTVVLLQHEYGLDPDAEGQDGEGTNFVEMAKAIHNQGLMVFVYLHTVLNEPNEHQKTILQELAKNCTGLIVTTGSAVNILASDTYGIKRSKVKHIDHGIRMQNPSNFDRLEIKKRHGLENHFLITTLGLHSPGKGLQYSIRAYARFLDESCTGKQKENILYLIAGACHPEFVRADGGKPYQEYQEMLEQVLKETKLRWCKIKELGETNLKCYNIIFLDTFLDEKVLMQLYGATNVMVIPYLEMVQISSGVLADTIGAGRVAIATKFLYAVELLGMSSHVHEGIVTDPHARGILVDPGEASVEQIAQGLDYLVFNKAQRLAMERRAHERGYQMRWDNTAWGLLQYIEFSKEELELVTGRGMKFIREKRSIFEK